MAVLRKNFFIYPRLQFKFLMMSVFLTLITAVVVYLTLHNVIFTSDRLMELSTFEIQSLLKSLRFALVWITLILLLAFGLENIFRFHRIAGPLFVIERMVRTFAAGDLSQDFKLRKGDELQGLVSELLKMKERLKDFVLKDREIIQDAEGQLAQLSHALDQGIPSSDIKKQIEKIRKDIGFITSQYKL